MSAYQNGQLRNGDNDNDQLQLLWIRKEFRMNLYVGIANILSARIILCILAAVILQCEFMNVAVLQVLDHIRIF